MSYEVIFQPSALREFDKLPKAAQQGFGKAIDDLAEEPRPQGAVKLTGVNAYRLRVGTYRMVYAVKDERLVVLIIKVGHRRDIYKGIETIKQRLKNEMDRE
jgi:mRNA interferase RelE/StbE